MIKIAIVDDDIVFTKQYKAQLTELFQKEQTEVSITTFSDATECLEANCSNFFKVLFLDIDLPEISGINLAGQIREVGYEPIILFVSAHNHFVFESIHYAPFRFIRKDMLESDTAEAVHALCSRLQHELPQLSLTLEDGSLLTLPVSEIVCFFSIRHDIYLYCRDTSQHRLAGRHYTLAQLSGMEQLFAFIQPHKAWLVNPRFIFRLCSNSLLLTSEVSRQGKEIIPLSRHRIKQVRQQYQSWLEREGIL